MFNQELHYQDEPNNLNSKNTKIVKKKVIWINLPYCNPSKINRGYFFFKLLDNHIDENNILTIFFFKSLKINYSCVKNVEDIILAHNSKLINTFHNSEVTDIDSQGMAEEK